MARGITLVGPHRDDLLIVAGGKALRAFGSRGQQVTAMLVDGTVEAQRTHVA